jgi:hypothetical protein
MPSGGVLVWRTTRRRLVHRGEFRTKTQLKLHALEQARADLGVVATRADSGGVNAVQWRLPGC